MTRWHEIGRRVDRTVRRLAATLIRATSLAAFVGIFFSLVVPWSGTLTLRVAVSTGIGYRFFYLLSGRCVGLTLGCLLAGWLLSRWDRAVGDGSRTRSHRLIRRLNVASLVIALFVPSLATRW